MEKLTDVLSSPVWWVTVVVAGVGINLVSAYLKSSLDGRLAKMSHWWRSRSEKRKAEFESYVECLSKDPQALTVACYNSLRQRFFVVLYLLLGMPFLLAAQLPVLLNGPAFVHVSSMCLGTFALFRASVCLLDARSIDETISKSQEKHRMAEESIPAYSVNRGGSSQG